MIWRKLLVGFGVVLAACSPRPPLRIETLDVSSILVDMQTLGEYPSTIGGARLVEESSGSVVWEIRSRKDPSKFSKFELRVGANEALPEGIPTEEYRVLIPNSRIFTLSRSTEYRLTVWGGSRSREASALFTFPSAQR